MVGSRWGGRDDFNVGGMEKDEFLIKGHFAIGKRKGKLIFNILLGRNVWIKYIT